MKLALVFLLVTLVAISQQQFQYNKSGMFIEANADKMDDISVMKFRHNNSFHQEIHFCLIGWKFW